MHPELTKRKDAFIALGEKLARVLHADTTHGLTAAETGLFEELKMGYQHNPWFTEDNIRSSLQGICFMLGETNMNSWLKKYEQTKKEGRFSPLTVAVIMAGNIPLVGFHDMMCVLLSGHRFLGKLSSQDKKLPLFIGQLLTEVDSSLKDYLIFEDEIIKGFDAVIATGSNNSGRYFDYYFGKYPHIIRRNRNSLAILTGNETSDELEALSSDIYSYFGMGCRNVSRIMVPWNYDIAGLLDHFDNWAHLKDHYKFHNNYEYQKAVLLVNNIPHYDNGFSLFREDERLSSPLSVLHYTRYRSLDEASAFVSDHSEEIQCIVASGKIVLPGNISTVKPGNAQMPLPDDYADGIDTMEFLNGLKVH